MARIVLPVMPFAGHVAPMAAVAAELVRRGHDVVAYTGAKYAPRVTAVGAGWEPWRQAPDFDDADLAATFPQVGDGTGVRAGRANGEHVVLRSGVGQARDLLDLAARTPVDAVVTDALAVGGALAAERLGLPWVTVSVTPLTLASRHLLPPGVRLLPTRTRGRRARDAVLRAAARVAIRRLLDPLITEVRAEVGLGPATVSGLDGLLSPHLVLAQGVPGLEYPRPDLPAAVRFVGRLAVPASARPDGALPDWWPEVERARGEGRPVVHVTQGTLHVAPGDLLRPTVEGLADSPALVVATTGGAAVDRLGALPPNVRTAPFLPHDALLPAVDAMVTNGGWGGVLAAVAAGVPLVVAGSDLDKPEVARRVAWSGVGVDLRTRRPRPAAVRAAVDRVLTTPGFRTTARELSRRMAATGGAATAADHVERMLAHPW